MQPSGFLRSSNQPTVNSRPDEIPWVASQWSHSFITPKREFYLVARLVHKSRSEQQAPLRRCSVPKVCSIRECQERGSGRERNCLVLLSGKTNCVRRPRNQTHVTEASESEANIFCAPHHVNGTMDSLAIRDSLESVIRTNSTGVTHPMERPTSSELTAPGGVVLVSPVRKDPAPFLPVRWRSDELL